MNLFFCFILDLYYEFAISLSCALFKKKFLPCENCLINDVKMCKSSNQSLSKAFWDLGRNCQILNTIPNQSRHNSQNILFWYFLKKRTAWFFAFAVILVSIFFFILERNLVKVQWNWMCWLRERKKNLFISF